MTTLLNANLRKLEDAIFDEKLSESERLDALCSLKAHYEEAQALGIKSHLWLSKSYTRMSNNYCYFSDKMSMEIAEGVMSIIPMDANDLKHVVELSYASHWAKDFAIENFISQLGVFQQESASDIKAVTEKIIMWRKADYFPRLMDHLLQQAAQETDEKYATNIVRDILHRVVKGKIDFGVAWMKKNDSILSKYPLKPERGCELTLADAFFLHEKGLPEYSKAAATRANYDVDVHAYLKRKELFGIELTEHTIRGIYPNSNCQAAQIFYLLHADGDLRLSEIGTSYSNDNYAVAKKFRPNVAPEREREVLSHIIFHMRDAKELILITDNNKDAIPQETLIEAYKHHLESITETPSELLHICLDADKKGITTGAIKNDEGELKELEYYLTRVSPYQMPKLLRCKNFLDIYSKEGFSAAFNRHLEGKTDKQLNELHEHVPDWLLDESPLIRRARLAVGMDI